MANYWRTGLNNVEGFQGPYLPPTAEFLGALGLTMNPPPAPVHMELNVDRRNEEHVYIGPIPTSQLQEPVPGPSHFVPPVHVHEDTLEQGRGHFGLYDQYGFTTPGAGATTGPIPQTSPSGGTMADLEGFSTLNISGFDELLRSHLIQQKSNELYAQNQEPPMTSTIGSGLDTSEGEPVTSTTTAAAAPTSTPTFDLRPPPGFDISQQRMNGPIFGETEMPQPLPPMNQHFTYPKFEFNQCHRGTDFYIHGTLPDISTDSTQFRITVTAPTGQDCFVTTAVDQLKRSRLICTFYPVFPGSYLVNVVVIRFPRAVHMRGSPFKIPVTRDFMDRQLQPRVLSQISHFTPGGHSVKVWGICVDRVTERIYIANKKLHRIHILTMAGSHLHTFGSHGAGPGQLSKPTGIAVDQINHRLLVTDKDNNRICIFTLNGDYMGSFGHRGHRDGEFNSPWGIAVSPNGDLIAVSDFNNHRIQLFGKFGEFRKTHKPSDKIIAPVGICFNNNGEYLYIADYAVQSIIVMSVDMTKKGTLTTPEKLHKPLGLVVDPAGNIIVCERESIRIVAPGGHLLYTILATHETFDTPLDITITEAGRLIFVDSTGTVFIY